MSNRLQTEIDELANYLTEPSSALWVQKVQGSRSEVIAGAILAWRPRGGNSAYIGDPFEPRRAAAQAILQARLAAQSIEVTDRLRMTVDDYQVRSERQTSWLLRLTWAIAALTAAQIVLAVIGILGMPLIDQTHSGTMLNGPSVGSQQMVSSAAPIRDQRLTSEMPEKCGRDAKEWFKEFHEGDSAPLGPVITLQNEYRNHYSERLSRCYVMVFQTQEISMAHKPPVTTHNMLLVDVSENREVGRFFDNHSGAVPTKCTLDGRSCASQEEWQSLAAEYMQN